jgi:predicted AAA+ superfamily ATPase
MNKSKQRFQLPLLQRGMKVMPVVVVTGARQTGKTTLVRELLHDTGRAYLTLDRLEILEQARSRPEFLVANPPLTLDEVQREPGLLRAIKHHVDENRAPGMYVLTGSANLSLMESVSETLAGRALYLELPPFCPVEWSHGDPSALHALDALFETDFEPRNWPKARGEWMPWALRGGFPPALALDNAEDRDLWFSGYVQTYLERDLRDLARIADLASFQKMMRLAAQRVGKLVNQSEAARDLDMPQPTAHRYFNLLEIGYQLTRLPVYATNPVSSLVKAKKLFWNDCGIAAWLAGIGSETELAARHDSGLWLEQAVFQTLQTWRSLDPIKRRLYYWRNRQGKEVDFVLEQQGKIVALEIKSADTVRAGDHEGLRAFRDALGKKKVLVRSAVLHAGTEARALDEDCYALPWGWMFPPPVVGA